MTTRPATANGDRSVMLIVEQLRRPVPGGIGTYTRELVRAIVDREDAAAKRLWLYASKVQGDDPLASLGIDLETSRLTGRALTRAWTVGWGAPPRGPAVVHACSLAVPPTRAQLVVTVHDLAFRLVPETFSTHGRRWHERALARVGRRAAHVVVPSEPVARQLADAGVGIGRDRIQVIPEGADHLGVPDDAGADGLLRRLGVDGRFILCVGTIEPRKNLTRLMAAFSEFRRGVGDSYTLVICGPMGWMADLQPVAGVVLTGHVEAAILAGLYAKAHVVAYVPLSEGFGLPVVEAMRYGAVVCSSDVPSAGDATLVVDPLDVDAIARGLEQCCEDDLLRAELRDRARAHVSLLTWARTAEAHLKLWNEVGAS